MSPPESALSIFLRPLPISPSLPARTELEAEVEQHYRAHASLEASPHSPPLPLLLTNQRALSLRLRWSSTTGRMPRRPPSWAPPTLRRSTRGSRRRPRPRRQSTPQSVTRSRRSCRCVRGVGEGRGGAEGGEGRGGEGLQSVVVIEGASTAVPIPVLTAPTPLLSGG